MVLLFISGYKDTSKHPQICGDTGSCCSVRGICVSIEPYRAAMQTANRVRLTPVTPLTLYGD